MADVFISYQRQERDAVEIVAEKLKALKFDVWFDEALRSGGSFDQDIADNLKAAKAVLVCWTPAAIGSEWVRGESVMAHNEGKLVACFLEPTELIPPFNLVHAENLMAWAGQEDDQAWLNLISRLGEIVGRQGLASYYRVMRPDAPVAELRAWANANGADPLVDKVWERVAQIEGESANDRIAREKAEARTRDLNRAESAARSKALAKARGLRDPKEQGRRLLRMTLALVVVGLLAAAGVGYSIYSNDRLRELDHVANVAGVRTFLGKNPWGPVHDEGLKKFYELDATDWAATKADGTIQAIDNYVAKYAGDPQGKFLATAKAATQSARRVADAQRLLQRIHLYAGRADGKLDEDTYHAVTLFQYRRGDIVSGDVDDNLIAALTQAVADRIAMPPSAIPAGRIGPPTEDDYRRLAARLKVDGPTLMAVQKVEARQGGFAPDGKLLILFEPHIFSRLTSHKFDESNPKVSYASWNPRGYPKDQAGRWAQLNEAFTLDPAAAYSAASYGSYSIMGQNFRAAGFETPSEFVQFMAESEVNQLEAFVRFADTHHILPDLQRRDWVGFARKYNGPANIDRYAQIMGAAYLEAAASFGRTAPTAPPATPTPVQAPAAATAAADIEVPKLGLDQDPLSRIAIWTALASALALSGLWLALRRS